MAAALPILAGAAAAPAVATPFTMGLMGAAANPLVASLAGGAALATTAAPVVASTAASAIPANIFANAALPLPSTIAAPAVDAGIFAPQFTGLNSSAMTNLPGQTLGRSSLSVGPQAPTFAQSAINTGQNIYGLMGENPGLTSVARQAGGAMMQPPPPPQVLQAPPIQSGQFAPVDFMSLLSQKPQQMQRRTSLLG